MGKIAITLILVGTLIASVGCKPAEKEIKAAEEEKILQKSREAISKQTPPPGGSAIKTRTKTRKTYKQMRDDLIVIDGLVTEKRCEEAVQKRSALQNYIQALNGINPASAEMKSVLALSRSIDEKLTSCPPDTE
jgi:hypothetical protein